MASTSQASQGLLNRVLRGVYCVLEGSQYVSSWQLTNCDDDAAADAAGSAGQKLFEQTHIALAGTALNCPC